MTEILSNISSICTILGLFLAAFTIYRWKDQQSYSTKLLLILDAEMTYLIHIANQIETYKIFHQMKLLSQQKTTNQTNSEINNKIHSLRNELINKNHEMGRQDFQLNILKLKSLEIIRENIKSLDIKYIDEIILDHINAITECNGKNNKPGEALRSFSFEICEIRDHGLNALKNARLKLK
jgi:hypothetical protein